MSDANLKIQKSIMHRLDLTTHIIIVYNYMLLFQGLNRLLVHGLTMFTIMNMIALGT